MVLRSRLSLTLVPRSSDPSSKTPAFKNVLVTVEPVAAKPQSVTREQLVAAAVHGRQAGDGQIHAKQKSC